MYELQKAGAWKRLSAFLFDFIISGILIIGMVLLLVWAFGFDEYRSTFKEKQEFYAAKYGISLDMTEEEYDQMSEAEKEEYRKNVDLSNRDIARDVEAIKAYNMIIYLPFIFLTLGIFVTFIIYEFILPLIFKNGQTLGKKIFGIGVIRTNCIKASNLSLFVRMAFGKFVIEVMFPIALAFMTLTGILNPLVALIVLLGMVVLEVISLLNSKRTRSAVHDLIADTAVVELSTQLVFESEEALLAHKKRVHEEMVSKAPY